MTQAKAVYVFGGGTFSYVRAHCALSAPAFGLTARQITDLCNKKMPRLDTHLILTKMANPLSNLVTNEDVECFVDKIIGLNTTKIIFMSAALCDFNGTIDGTRGKDVRLKTVDGPQTMELTPASKIISKIRKNRKDIFLIGFKTTCGATENEQYIAGLNLCKKSSCNLVLANDIKTRLNMIITPEEAQYGVTFNRNEVLEELVNMTKLRSHLTFTRSTVVSGKPVPWSSELVPEALRTVVNYCIGQGAYKPFNGVTVGHFACKLDEKTFLTSIRRTNFNDLPQTGLVRIETDGPDAVIAYGSKPSVGGQSQRIVFHDHQEYDCIVHFHCPLKEKPMVEVPSVSQREYECGSHECGQNTSSGLKKFGNLSAVYLKEHGPNIVFHHSIDPQEVIKFIEDNFDLSQKTGGFVEISLQ